MDEASEYRVILTQVNWRRQAQSILISSGLIGLGVMLGAHYMAVRTRAALAPQLFLTGDLSAVTSAYQTAMVGGGTIAVIGLCIGVLLTLRGESNED